MYENIFIEMIYFQFLVNQNAERLILKSQLLGMPISFKLDQVI